MYPGHYPLIEYVVCKYLLLFTRLSFHSEYGFLCFAKGFSLIYSHFLVLVLFHFLWIQIHKNVTKPVSRSMPPMFSSMKVMVLGITFKSLIHILSSFGMV